SGLLGLDVDGSAGERLLAELSGGDLPATLEFTTPGGGRRLLWRWPDRPLPRGHFPVRGSDAVRVLAGGSYTVMPPSRHQFGGTYAWVAGRRPGDLDPAPCPPWLLQLLPTGPAPPAAPEPEPPAAPPAPRAHTRRFADIQRQPVQWLWPGWIPLGKLTLLDGDPGLGKSTLLLDLAARVSRDGVMPDGSRGTSGAVVLLSA